MDTRRQAEGGWEAAVDPSLAARLLRPAVRPGISDPAHGRTLAARLLRATEPTLADDVARRYGSAALEGDRPPVVYAAPPPPSAGAAVSPATGPQAADGGAEAGSSSASPAPLQARADAPRPVVRAAERTSGPVFPPLRPLVAGPAVQRRSGPVAVPVVRGRRAVAVARAAATDGAEDAAAESSAPARPVVAPAPTRLQRQLAAERAAAPPPSTVQRVLHPDASLPPRVAGRRVEGEGTPAPSVVVHAERSGAVAGVADSGDATRPATPGMPAVAPRPASGPDAALTPAFPAPAAQPAGIADTPSAGTGGGGGAPGSGAAVAAPAGEGRGAVQRMPLRDGVDARSEEALPRVVHAAPAGSSGTAADGSRPSGGRPVVAAPAGEGRGAVQRMPLRDGVDARSEEALPRVVHAAPSGSSGMAADGSRPSGGRPVVAAPAGRGAGAVQRMPLAGAAGATSAGTAARLVHRVPAPAAATQMAVQRKQATRTPPPGAPPAELPTATAAGARHAGADPARLAEQVYDILVRRLENERKQRGW
jgi:hypothetical protein